VESSARIVAVLLLRHLGIVAGEFSENRDRLFARSVDPINAHAVVRVGVFCDLEFFCCLFVVCLVHCACLLRLSVAGKIPRQIA
jgi:hypothetical protein